MRDFRCELIERGLHITGVAQNINGEDYAGSFVMSIDQASLSWNGAMEWAKEKGDGYHLPNRVQLVAIKEHKNEINKVLEAHGLTTLIDWYWTNEEYSPQSAWLVNMGYGSTYCNNKYLTYGVRAVSAFQI